MALRIIERTGINLSLGEITVSMPTSARIVDVRHVGGSVIDVSALIDTSDTTDIDRTFEVVRAGTDLTRSRYRYVTNALVGATRFYLLERVID